METKYTERFVENYALSKFSTGQTAFMEYEGKTIEVKVVGFILISTDTEHWVLIDDNRGGRMRVRESDLHVAKPINNEEIISAAVKLAVADKKYEMHYNARGDIIDQQWFGNLGEAIKATDLAVNDVLPMLSTVKYDEPFFIYIENHESRQWIIFSLAKYKGDEKNYHVAMIFKDRRDELGEFEKLSDAIDKYRTSYFLAVTEAFNIL